VNGVHYWRLCGLLLGAGFICGCDGSRTSPSQSQTASQSTGVARRSEQTDVATAQWELDPPKSVTAAKSTAPHDPGAVFMHYCSVCHGPEGRGDGQYYSDELPSRPANLTDQKAMELLSDDHLTLVITGGSVAVGKSPLCPPWGRVFSKEQVAELVVHVRQLSSQEINASQDVQEGQK
jgi:mono/diheme cytochrome c family protein